MQVRENRDPVVRLAFSRRLYSLRRAYGAAVGRPKLSQTEFAKALGIGGERYRRYERGDMEPPLGVLATMRLVTGCSLDMLIAGETPGRHDVVPVYGGREDELTLGERIGMVREMIEPNVAHAAAVMGVPLIDWLAWEGGQFVPPVEKVEEFAHRFGASMDFLYRGLLVGLSDDLLQALHVRFPRLIDAPHQPAGPGGLVRSYHIGRGRPRGSIAAK